jgi:hypothetical protein
MGFRRTDCPLMPVGLTLAPGGNEGEAVTLLLRAVMPVSACASRIYGEIGLGEVRLDDAAVYDKSGFAVGGLLGQRACGSPMSDYGEAMHAHC